MPRQGGEGGTTSACAENTLNRIREDLLEGNYLRVRGEYGYTPDTIVMHPELPPRARRIQKLLRVATKQLGTTSACAENTFD